MDKFADKKLIHIEEALDRRINHNGMVEYLVKLYNEDKMEWVAWTNIYCPQLMNTEKSNPTTTLNFNKHYINITSQQQQPSSSNGIIDI